MHTTLHCPSYPYSRACHVHVNTKKHIFCHAQGQRALLPAVSKRFYCPVLSSIDFAACRGATLCFAAIPDRGYNVLCVQLWNLFASGRVLDVRGMPSRNLQQCARVLDVVPALPWWNLPALHGTDRVSPM
jgi:hypothetical protein